MIFSIIIAQIFYRFAAKIKVPSSDNLNNLEFMKNSISFYKIWFIFHDFFSTIRCTLRYTNIFPKVLSPIVQIFQRAEAVLGFFRGTCLHRANIYFQHIVT